MQKGPSCLLGCVRTAQRALLQAAPHRPIPSILLPPPHSRCPSLQAPWRRVPAGTLETTRSLTTEASEAPAPRLSPRLTTRIRHRPPAAPRRPAATVPPPPPAAPRPAAPTSRTSSCCRRRRRAAPPDWLPAAARPAPLGSPMGRRAVTQRGGGGAGVCRGRCGGHGGGPPFCAPAPGVCVSVCVCVRSVRGAVLVPPLRLARVVIVLLKYINPYIPSLF